MPEDLSAIFGPGGRLARAHPSYEHRAGQTEMAEAVARGLAEGRHLLVEAGTGTGKTLAYLVPAVLSGLKVIVSTGTKTLQDQVVERDVPLISRALGVPVQAAVMKGRENYLCRRRFREFDREPMFRAIEEAGPFAEVRSWSRSTRTGDRADVPGLPDDAAFWPAINAKGDTCTGTRCEDYDDCFLTVMKRRAAECRLVVVNHHLFFADLALRQDAYGRILPDYDRVIFDEAHLLESVATRYFGLSLSSRQVRELADDAERTLASVSGRRERGPVREAVLAGRSRGRRRRRFDETERLRHAADAFFGLFGEAAGGRTRFRAKDLDPAVRAARAALGTALAALASTVRALATAGEAAALLERRAGELAATLGEILDTDDEEMVTWAERRGRSIALVCAPVDVAAALGAALFGPERGAVLTSATLSVRGDFSFARQRLGLDQADELVLSSPFDHRSQAVLYLPASMPAPNERDFIARLVEEVVELVEITRGRAFVLFTSFANLRKAREALVGRIDYPLITQGEGSKGALLDRFRDSGEAVLLGTSSFWQGVDVPGEALSLVIVDKLPFEVPVDPLVSARIDRIRSRGGDPFNDYQLPAAVIELKQGLGRLIRSSRDRGALAVLDPRLRTRSYGRVFLESLPPFPRVGTTDEVRAFFERDPDAPARVD